MNYNIIYNTLILSRQQLNRKKFKGEYYESHHIIPKSLGGPGRKINIVLLTAKEHFIAHLLLYKMHSGKNKAKMANALFKMCNNNLKQKREFNSRYYVFAKTIMNKFRFGENTTFFGKKHSEETIQKMRESKKGKNNPAFGKIPWNKGLTKDTSDGMKKISNFGIERYKNPDNRIGKKHSAASKQKMSRSTKGITKSDEHKRKLSEANKGKRLLDVTKQKISTSLKGRKPKIYPCYYCGREMSLGTLNRWHNENCKFKCI
jgi:hypothetical protein